MRISKLFLVVAITALTANAFAAGPVKCSHQPKISLFANTAMTSAEQMKIDSKSAKGQR